MRRTLLSSRSLGLLAVALVAAALCLMAGLWQLRVAREDARQDALDAAFNRPVATLTEVVQPHAAFPADGSNQRVQALGRYEADKQLLIPDRRLDGAEGYWVLTPLTVSATGARLPVVRGFVRSPSDATAPLSTGELTVTGSLAPSESPQQPSRPLAAGELASVDVARLVNMWDGKIYNAFVFAITETPDATAAGPSGASAAGTIERVPPPELPSGLSPRNAAYALQWWVFGLFALWMWWRMVRDQHRRSAVVGVSPGEPPPAESPLAESPLAESPAAEASPGEPASPPSRPEAGASL